MAFDATKRDRANTNITPPAGANPYDDVLSGPPGTSSASLAGSSGATPTGYVNFGDFYNANGAAAQAGAQNLQASAGAKGQAAQQGLTGAQQTYNQAVKAGTPGAPTSQDFWTASGYQKDQGLATGKTSASSTGRASGKTPTATAPAAPTNSPPTGWTASGNGGTDADNQRWAAGAAAAEKGYTGPNALSDETGYSDLLNQTTAAQDEATALAGGNSGIAGALQGSANTDADAALLGAAGRQGFTALGQKYGGLVNSLNAADTRSQAESDQAKQDSANALQQYGLLAQQEQATQDQRAQEAAWTPTAAAAGADNPITSGVDQTPTGDPRTWNTAQWIRNIGSFLSPVDDIAHATGNDGPIDVGTDYFENNYGPIGGKKSTDVLKDPEWRPPK